MEGRTDKQSGHYMLNLWGEKALLTYTTSSLEATFQILAVLSPETVNTSLPSSLKST
jgi:hypothetical protein